VGSVHAHKYGFPFQQHSTSCGTYSTFFVYKIVTYLISILRYLQKCYITYFTILPIYQIHQVLYRITIRKSSEMASCFRSAFIAIERKNCVISTVSRFVHIAYYRKYCKT